MANEFTVRVTRDSDGQSFDIPVEAATQEEAEQALCSSLVNAQRKVRPLLATRSYAEVLNELADLRDPIDRFFDNVMVMVDDDKVKTNRLALLGELRALFLDVADISRMSIG